MFSSSYVSLGSFCRTDFTDCCVFLTSVYIRDALDYIQHTLLFCYYRLPLSSGFNLLPHLLILPQRWNKAVLKDLPKGNLGYYIEICGRNKVIRLSSGSLIRISVQYLAVKKVY